MKKDFTILLLIVFAAIASFAQNERRLALVIGNAEYEGKGNTLRTPVNDANDVAIKLKALGFDVTTVLNASVLEMDDAIDAFGQKAKNYDVALFYYSGHGLQSKGENYLVPVDAELTTEASIRARCSSVNYLLDLLDESGCPMKVVCLDACRNNPFERSRGFSKGLSGIDASKGTLISFATAKGKTADDGDERNSPYTTAFLNALDQPNLLILDFFNTISNQVERLTHEAQIPWTNYSSLKGDFCFNKQVMTDSKLIEDNSFITIIVNDVSFEMVLVNSGSFLMGGNNSDANANEKPTHNVTVSAFYIGETEVTQSLWNAVMDNNPSLFKGENLPVESVSWNDCQVFIEKLNRITGKQFRLPTEAEWEFAARGGNKGKGTLYSGGKNIEDIAWYSGNSNKKTHPVKTKLPNELGIYDMSGNVWEWCSDWFGYYNNNSQVNPQGSDMGTYRIVRGGSWFGYPTNCRVSCRDICNPDNNSYSNGGFRLVLNLY